MLFTLKVEPDDAVLSWAIFVDKRPVVDFNRDLEAVLRLNPGEHRLTYDVRGAGSQFEILIKEEPTIVDPEGERWPFTVNIPGDRLAAYDAIYFEV